MTEKNEQSIAESKERAEIVLGFLEPAEPWELRSPHFPSKVGGRPAWLSQRELPSSAALECDICRLPMAFLLQVYAPVAGLDSFHRTLFLFCCKTPTCYIHNDSRCMKVFRSQLPRKNEFYSSDPPKEDEPPSGPEPDPTALPVSGAKLCWLCGCPGQKACSRCHTVTYCSKQHQTVHWKHSHKRECCHPESSTVTPSPFLFPESELVTEPEEEGDSTGEEEEEIKKSCSSPSLVDDLSEKELEEMALQETEDNKVFQRFKKRIAAEPHQVIRYCRGGAPLWISAQHIPSDDIIPQCTCGAKRTFEFQVMPQLLNSLGVDSTGSSIDWGTLAIYTCSHSCSPGNKYSPEFIWKQDIPSEQQE